ncbi:MAG: DEAD/DEAH box helicase, partial [Phycisphaerae bacterium]|nr:DEAD/DEAH box helicase [Phycisphaerae bacterium]
VKHTLIYGGVGQGRQVNAVSRGVHILVATPGRLLDLMNQKLIDLRHVEFFILDEADRMLDMGFIHDVRRVLDAVPEKRQTLFFSATMPPAVAKLSQRMLTDPVRVDVAPKTMTADRIAQTLMFVDKGDKRKLLEMLLMDSSIQRALVFSRTKHGADRITRDLVRADIAAGAIHGNKSQNARTRALAAFKNGKYRVLVATDIAARGIDVDGVSHVINFDLPNESESYVHRIGRTARAGKAGKAISFCAGDEMGYLREIQKLIKRKIPLDCDHSFHSEEASHGMENGAPALSPAQKQSKARAGQARRRKELKEGTARPARGSRQGQKGKARRSQGGAKGGPKGGARATESRGAIASGGKSRRRRRPRRSSGI